jgi:hypothetical protein
MLAAVADRVQGVQVSAPLGRVSVALEVLEAAVTGGLSDRRTGGRKAQAEIA